MLTGEDGSRRFGYCRRLLVSKTIRSSEIGGQGRVPGHLCISTNPSVALSYVKAFDLLNLPLVHVLTVEG